MSETRYPSSLARGFHDNGAADMHQQPLTDHITRCSPMNEVPATQPLRDKH